MCVCGMAGVEMIDRGPVEPGVEVALHLADEIADERLEVGETSTVLGRDDEAELVRVVARAAEQLGRIDIVVRGIVELARLALARGAVAQDVLQVRAGGAEIAARDARVAGAHDDAAGAG